MPACAYFGPGLFKFLTDLKKHNDRDWFLAHQSRYFRDVRDPFLALIADLAPQLARIGSGFIADPHPTRGSMMRIYRDIRFSADKSPYKTHIAAQFMHGKGKHAGIGLYLQFAPGRSIAGGGVWRPEPLALRKIRDQIARDPRAWRKASLGKMKSGGACALGGESLKRAPAGYDPNHPCIEDIQRRDFYLGAELIEKQVTSPDLFAAVLDRFRAAAPLAEFLANALSS